MLEDVVGVRWQPALVHQFRVYYSGSRLNEEKKTDELGRWQPTHEIYENG
jgi:hypothetical protein